MMIDKLIDEVKGYVEKQIKEEKDWQDKFVNFRNF
jgi:hypothetical protein